ncbi:MAG: helix-hairpin-helix domain-containing protein [Planctomycetia bacterium]|nr:helix-hairpin-helix domain-containing protein [Planctomycetia bacterium]
MKHKNFTPLSKKQRSIFQQIPCVDRETARDLEELGFHSLEQLADGDPDDMFQKLQRLRGGTLSRDILAIFRCAVYTVSEDYPENDKLRWWNWKD